MSIQQYKTYFTAFSLAAVLLVSCNGGQQQTEAAAKDTASAEKEKRGNAGELELSREQMETVGIETGAVETKNLNAIVQASGQLAVPPQNKADVSVLSGGILRKIMVLEGQQVKKGQLLATIENQDLVKIQQDYLAAKNNFGYTRAEYDRQQQLKAAGAGTGKSWQLAEANFRAESARIAAYETQLVQLGLNPSVLSSGHILSGFPLKAPISGTVGQITVNLGAYIQPGTSIMEVVDNSKIHCDLIVFEKDLMKVKAGQQVNFQLTNQDNQQISGMISGINKSFENESKGVIVHAVINNTARQNLIPGMYVTALISVGTAVTPAVPVDAVIRAEGREYIYVVSREKPGSVWFRKAEVKTGVSELGYTAVKSLDGLAEGVKIARKGAFYLQSRSAGNVEED